MARQEIKAGARGTQRGLIVSRTPGTVGHVTNSLRGSEVWG